MINVYIAMTDLKFTRSRVAVDPTYHWRPMESCPLNRKVQLLNRGGVAVYGQVRHTEEGKISYEGWAPLPTRALVNNHEGTIKDDQVT